MAYRRSYKPQQGFTLVEVLVAFTVLMVSLGVLYGMLHTTRQRSEELLHAASALSIAQSLMAEHAQTQQAGEGVIKDYHWQVTLFRYPVTPDPSQPNDDRQQQAHQHNPIKLVQIAVQVNWHKGRGAETISLVTLRPAKQGLW